MAEDNAKGKLTLSGKSTLTLKNLGKTGGSEGRKMVQVEVRKKRTISPSNPSTPQKVEIDEATAQKLRLIAEAKEHDAKRRQEEEAKEQERLRQKEEQEQERLRQKEEQKAEEARKAEDEAKAKKQAEEKAAQAKKETSNKPQMQNKPSFGENDDKYSSKNKHNKDFDDDDEDDF